MRLVLMPSYFELSFRKDEGKGGISSQVAIDGRFRLNPLFLCIRKQTDITYLFS